MIHVLEVFIKVLYLGIEHTIDVSCILLINKRERHYEDGLGYYISA